MISIRLLRMRPPTRRHHFRCDGCRKKEETFYAAPTPAGGMHRRFAGELRRKGWWTSPDGRRHVCPGCVRDAVAMLFGADIAR